MKKHIPNCITCCNLISGCIATAFAFGGNLEIALVWMKNKNEKKENEE